MAENRPSCTVSYTDLDDTTHSVQVDAGSLYEAAILALKIFREHDCEPKAGPLKVEVRPAAVTHTVMVGKVRAWLESSGKSPRDLAERQRLRAIWNG